MSTTTHATNDSPTNRADCSEVHERYRDFAAVKANDATVSSAVAGGASMGQIVIYLANEKAALLDRLMELEAIAPRRITLPDGRSAIFRCPDHLVPN